MRAYPSRESTHLCVPAARIDAPVRRFARRRSPGRRRFSPTGCLRAQPQICAGVVLEGQNMVIRVVILCVYYYRTFYKAVRVGEEESGGHVL